MFTTVQVKIDEGLSRFVNLARVSRNIETKPDAICEIIKEWGDIQTVDINTIKEKLLKKLKEEYKDIIEEKKIKMKKCWEEYTRGIESYSSIAIKKFKLSEEKIEGYIESGGEEGDNDKEYKLAQKVFNHWEDYICKLQDRLAKKYYLKPDFNWLDHNGIEHEESFWCVHDTYKILALEYNQGEEEIKLKDKGKDKSIFIKKDYFEVRLRWDMENLLEIIINLVRGENSLNNIIKESREYIKEQERVAQLIEDDNNKIPTFKEPTKKEIKKADKEAQKIEDSMTKDDWDKVEAQEELSGI